MKSELPKRTLALDVGDRRIGIAITDLLGITVQGRPTRVRASLQEDIAHIRRIVEEDDVQQVVVGHPRHMDGSPSLQTKKTEAFAESLRLGLDVPIVLWDERLTSFAAEQSLVELGLDWRSRRKHVDRLAATLILEDYLSEQA